MRRPLVSVIVPTFNSEDFLGMCLGSVRAQTYANIELIVVDNYSKDRTKEIALRYADSVLLKGPERSAQVNFGVQNAEGKYVYRVDSDFVVDRNVIQEAVNKCEAGEFDAICVHNTSDSSVSFWARVRKLERDCYTEDRLHSAARFFRKVVFEKVGGYNQKLVAAEDYDLQNRLVKNGFRIGFIRSGEIHIGEPTSLLEIARKHYRYGRTMKRFLNANPIIGMKQVNPVRKVFIGSGRNFVKHPPLAAGFCVYQIIKYSAAGFGFLVSLGEKD